MAGKTDVTSHLQSRCWGRYYALPNIASAAPQVVPPLSATPVAHGGGGRQPSPMAIGGIPHFPAH
eukprot:16431215-Heterocapsa_arctica.AAC.1